MKLKHHCSNVRNSNMSEHRNTAKQREAQRGTERHRETERESDIQTDLRRVSVMRDVTPACSALMMGVALR